MRQVFAEKLCPKGERKVKVQGAADQVKDFSMQLDLIDKHKGKKERSRRRKTGVTAANTYCMQYSFYLLGLLTTHSLVGLHLQLLSCCCSISYDTKQNCGILFVTRLWLSMQFQPDWLKYICLSSSRGSATVCVLVFGFVAVCYSDCIFSKAPSLCICFAVLLWNQAKAPTYWTSPGSRTWT